MEEKNLVVQVIVTGDYTHETVFTSDYDSLHNKNWNTIIRELLDDASELYEK